MSGLLQAIFETGGARQVPLFKLRINPLEGGRRLPCTLGGCKPAAIAADMTPTPLEEAAHDILAV